MKIAVIIIRSLIGLLLLFASISYFAGVQPKEAPPADIISFMNGITTIHLMTVVKTIELICGIAFITGRFVTLANIIIFPIVIGIVLFHSFLAPDTIASGILLLLGVLFLAWYHRENYVPLFKAGSFKN